MKRAIAAALVVTALGGCGGTQARREPPVGRTRPPAHGRVARSVVTRGPRDRDQVALTFDADMTRPMLAAVRGGQALIGYDPRIVLELRASHTPATIFITGLWPTAHPDAARDLAADPLFEIENHTFDHSAFAHPCYGLPGVPSRAAKTREIERAANAIEQLTGSSPRYFRFPGGCHRAEDARLVARLGERPVQWDVISGDAYLRDPSAVARRTLARVQPGSIVVMHLVGAPTAPATADALRTILRGLRDRGLRAVRLRTLLAP